MTSNRTRLLAPVLALALVSVHVLPAFAADSPTSAVKATHLVGVSSLKSGASATVSVQNGALQIDGKSGPTTIIKLSSVEDVYTGTEATQGGGKVGQAAKVGAMAAPYDAGAVLTLILWVKVDLLTVLYRGENGDLHSVLLTVTKGKADPLRSQMIAGGAHATERKAQ